LNNYTSILGDRKTGIDGLEKQKILQLEDT